MNKGKAPHLFRVSLYDFGTGGNQEHLTKHIVRVGRPGAAVFDIVGTEETSSPSIDIDLHDDLRDHTRAEVLTQLAKQMKEHAEFSMHIEILDEREEQVEFWHLTGCRIVDCRLDELNRRSPECLMIHLTIASQRIATRLFGEIVKLFP